MSNSLLLFTALLALTRVSGQDRTPKIDQLLGATSAQGTEFWIAIPANELIQFPVNELEIYIASAYDTDVQIFDASAQKAINRKVTKGNILTLSSLRQETSWSWEVREAETRIRKGIRITSRYPVSVYVLNSRQTTSEGFLAIPCTNWGTDYISCSYYDFKEFAPWAGGFCVVAKENGTVLNIDLRGVGELDAKTSGGKSINSGKPVQVTLDEGEVYMVKGDATTRGMFDLTGSRIRSNKPVGFISFHERTTMPNLLVAGNGRNNLCEMLPPVNMWGKSYSTVEFKRKNANGIGRGDVFRVVAAHPNTKWNVKYYDLTTKALVGQGGGILTKSGDFADIAQAAASTLLTYGFSTWNADKPVFVMQYACSQTWDGDNLLDPMMINVTPGEQYVSSAIFQFPTVEKFAKHRLNLIVYADSSDPAYIDNLKSLVVDGVPVWSHSSADPDLPKLLSSEMPGGNGLHSCSIEFERSGKSHTITSNGKIRFGGYLYGWGASDAYGWPLGAAYRTTTSMDTLPPVLRVIEDCGNYHITAEELRNDPILPRTPPHDSDQVETGISAVEFDNGTPDSNYRIVLGTAQSLPRTPSYKSFDFKVEVIDKSRDAFAIIRVSDFGTNSEDGDVNYVLDTLRYTADLLGLPEMVSFGKRRVGSRYLIQVSLTNDDSKPINIGELKLLKDSLFNLKTGPTIPITLSSGESLTHIIEYDASHDSTTAPIGKDLDTLIITTRCGEFRIPVSGYALEPKILVGDFHAGTVPENQLKCDNVRIENPGSDTLIISGIAGYQASSGFGLSNPFTPVLPIVVPPKIIRYLQAACYESAQPGAAEIAVTFHSNAASGDSVSRWTANMAVGVEAIEPITLVSASPQPANDVLCVRLPELLSRPAQLTLVDITGSIAGTWTVNVSDPGTVNVQISTLASGAYTLIVSTSLRSYLLPVVIVR